MGIRDLLFETWHSLSSNKARSFLTILGIVIGIASVIAMTSLIGGMQNMFMSELGLYQARMVQISGGMQPLQEADLEALERSFPEYDSLAGVTGSFGTASTAQKAVDADLIGVTDGYFDIMNLVVESGRLLTSADGERGAQVIVVGRGVVRDLFGAEDAQVLGETIRIKSSYGSNSETFTIVGVFEGGGTTQMFSAILMPASTMQARITGSKTYNTVLGLANDNVDVVDLTERTRLYLVERLHDEYVYAYSMKELLDQLNTVMMGFSLMLVAIASISLFVGGIGIMNMMLTNVTERTREIGLRKSLGAHTSDITLQFLAESIALCLVGGLFGTLFGFLGALALGAIVNLAQDIGATFAPAIGLSSILIAVGVCAFIGIVFGFYPARRAAKLDPVESLRYQ